MWASFRKRCSPARTNNNHTLSSEFDNTFEYTRPDFLATDRGSSRVTWVPGLKQKEPRQSLKIGAAQPLACPPGRRHRRRRASHSRPVIQERESSLYPLPANREDLICSPSTASFGWEATSPLDDWTPSRTFYGLPYHAQSVFGLPSPSGKKSLTLLDIQSHEDIWEQVFDSAARCSFYRQSAPQAAHWKPWTTSLDLPSTRAFPTYGMAQVVVEGEEVEWRDSFEQSSSRSSSVAPATTGAGAPSRPARSALRHTTAPADAVEAESPASATQRYQPRPSVAAAFDRFNSLDFTSPVLSQDTPVLNLYPSPVLEAEEPHHGARSMYQLAVDRPLPEDSTPPLSSASTDDGQSAVITPRPATLLAPVELPSFNWRKRSTPQSRDPLKVRDGVESRASSSGVYTPRTFPGPQGPPSLAPPIGFDPRAGPPSRSGSLSSGFSDASSALQTPHYSPNRSSFSSVARASFSGIGRRMSSLSVVDKRGSTSSSLYVTTGHPDGAAGSVPPYSASSAWSEGPPVTPTSRPTWGSYFSWGTSSSPASGETTPNPNPGLGLGALVPPPLSAKEARLSYPDHPVEVRQTLAMEEFGSPVLDQGPGSPDTSGSSLGAKSKRKPVPRLEEEAQIPDEEGGEEMVDMRRRVVVA